MSTLRLIEIYSSVQGETSLMGYPTTFVRLAACNLRCAWCDTTYSFGRGEEYQISSVIETIKDFGFPYVCITGGEPLLQSGVHELMKSLLDLGYHLSLETGGSLSTAEVDPRVKVILDIKCPGSKMEKKNLWENLDFLRPHDEVKFVLVDKEDYHWAQAICLQHRLFEKNRTILFSPVHGQLCPKELVRWILDDRLPVRLNLQIHKYIWTPETKGV